VGVCVSGSARWELGYLAIAFISRDPRVTLSPMSPHTFDFSIGIIALRIRKIPITSANYRGGRSMFQYPGAIIARMCGTASTGRRVQTDKYRPTSTGRQVQADKYRPTSTAARVALSLDDSCVRRRVDIDSESLSGFRSGHVT
jgi:hypothetical protein